MVASALLMVYAYLCTPVLGSNVGLTNLTESYGALERVALWQRTFDWLPGAQAGGRFATWETWQIAWAARIAFAGMFAAHAWAFWLIWTHRPTRLWPWLIGPVLTHAVMILLVPSNADVFFYEMTGDLAAKNINPYVHPLMDFPSNPLLAYNHWIEMTAVYGPVWTGINATIMSITGPDPALATVVYKIVLGIVTLALALLVGRFVKLLTHRDHLALVGTVLVAWQPNLIIESTGQAHNDPLVLLLCTAGIMLAVAGGTRAIRGGMVLVTLSVLVKYVTLPILGLLAMVRLVDRRQKRGFVGVFGSWVLDGVAILAVMFAAFGPFWSGFDTIKQMLLEPGRLYTNPIWFDPYMLLDTILPHWVASAWVTITRVVLQLAAIALMGFTVIRFIHQMWEIPDHGRLRTLPPAWTTPLLTGWAIIMAVLALLPVNSHPWYWTWPIAPIAILLCDSARGAEHIGRQPHVPRWFWGYLLLTALMTLAYHTRIVHI